MEHRFNPAPIKSSWFSKKQDWEKSSIGQKGSSLYPYERVCGWEGSQTSQAWGTLEPSTEPPVARRLSGIMEPQRHVFAIQL